MMRRVVITGIGVVGPHGIGGDAMWRAISSGASAVRKIEIFDASAFPSRIAGAAPPFKTTDHVPKSYRKATKIMARDIELAVVAADGAVRDARLATKGVLESTADQTPPPSFTRVDPERIGCNIGAGLLNADLDELTAAMATARGERDTLSLAKWGRSDDPAKTSGMEHLTPLWLLKYLPNMLACHVSIIHDTRGPSNTITCGQASAGLALGEAVRTIQRGKADVALVGGCETRLQPMGLMRWALLNRLAVEGDDNPGAAVRPLDKRAAGTAVSEGGAVLAIEELEHAKARGATIYCEVVGLGATASAAGPTEPDPGPTLLSAARKALRDAGIAPADVQAILPPAYGVPDFDRADGRVLNELFAGQSGWRVTSIHGGVGDCGAGAQAWDLAAAALAIRHQQLFPMVNCDDPIADLPVQRSLENRTLNHVLVLASSVGGQNAAVVLKRHG